MLRFKLIPTRDKATYLIKVNNKIIDHGILYTNDTPVWSQREPITLEYKGITFKDSKKNDYISISCTNAGSGREIYIQEIHVDDIEVIAEGLGVSYREDANFHVEHIVSGCSRNLDAVMTHDYSDVVILDRAGIMGDWIVVVKQPSGHVACWDEHLYFEKDNITFKEPGYYLDVINELRKQDKERQEQEQKARKAEEEAAQLEKEKEDKKIAEAEQKKTEEEDMIAEEKREQLIEKRKIAEAELKASEVEDVDSMEWARRVGFIKPHTGVIKPHNK